MSRLRPVFIIAAAYLGSSIAGAAIAIAGDLPAEFGGRVAAEPNVAREFMLTWGTAMSAPLPILIAFALVVVLTTRRGRVGRYALVALILACVGFLVGQLGEPITRDVASSPAADIRKTTVVAANAVLPVLLGVASVRGLWLPKRTS